MKLAVEIKNNKATEIEITGEIPVEIFNTYRPTVINDYTQNVTIPGFRKGKAPEKLVAEKVGEDKILLEMAEKAIQEHYPEIIKEKNLNVIGRPDVQITKLAKDNPLGFKIVTAILPDIKLPDYKKIASEVRGQEKTDIVVSDEEVDKELTHLQKSRSTPPAKEGDSPILPELNDDFAKSLGHFETLVDLKNKIKENLTKEKEHLAKEKLRIAIVEKIGEKIEIELPDILVKNELHKMLMELQGQIEQMGLKFNDYLTHLKKTEEDLKKDWQLDAEKRVKFGLVMHRIAEEAKISPTFEEIEKETEAIISYYQGASQKLDRTRVSAHAENMLINEKVFELLEQA